MRQILQVCLMKRLLFQSTHPCRMRLTSLYYTKNGTCFNPRTHVGCDNIPLTTIRPLRGFNPRTHVGCDDRALRSVNSSNSFNPRTHVGCDSRFTSFSYS